MTGERYIDYDTSRERRERASREAGSVAFKPTQALERGECNVAQCSQCGTLVCWPTQFRSSLAGQTCPGCLALPNWWQQTLPVGPFR